MNLPAQGSGLDGAWVPICAMVSGQELDLDELRVARFVLESGCYEIVDHEDRTVDRGDLRVDDSASPCEMDIVGVQGPYAGRTMYAIFELDGDRLTVCYDLESSERPANMHALGDQLLLVITYARAARRLS